jgi:hypothetical protein
MLEDSNTPNIVSPDSNLKAVTLKGKPKASALGGFTEIHLAAFLRGRMKDIPPPRKDSIRRSC